MVFVLRTNYQHLIFVVTIFDLVSNARSEQNHFEIYFTRKLQ